MNETYAPNKSKILNHSEQTLHALSKNRVLTQFPAILLFSRIWKQLINLPSACPPRVFFRLFPTTTKSYWPVHGMLRHGYAREAPAQRIKHILNLIDINNPKPVSDEPKSSEVQFEPLPARPLHGSILFFFCLDRQQDKCAGRVQMQ